MMRNSLGTLAVCAGLLLSAVACSNPPVTPAPSATPHNDLMLGASPKTSCLTMYYFDGAAGYTQMTCDAQTQQIIDRLSAVEATPAPDWGLDDVTMPVYGFDMGSVSGLEILPAWSNGYWITQKGEAYQYQLDFAKLVSDFTWQDKRDLTGLTNFPSARWLVQDDSGWRPQLMERAPELKPPADVTLTLDQWASNSVTVTFHNDSDTEFGYGEAFELQVQLDLDWYNMPPVPGNWGFDQPLYLIPAGGTATKTYDLTMYGQLPVATYRLVASDLDVVFSVCS